MKSWEWNTIIEFCECIDAGFCPDHAKANAEKEMKKYIKISSSDAEKEEIAEIKDLLEVLRKTTIHTRNQVVAEIMSVVEECGYAED